MHPRLSTSWAPRPNKGLSRLKGDDIDYAKETDTTKVLLFTIVSRMLLIQLFILIVAIGYAGYLSLAKVRGWH